MSRFCHSQSLDALDKQVLDAQHLRGVSLLSKVSKAIVQLKQK